MTATIRVEPVTDEIRRSCLLGDVTDATAEVVVKRVGGEFYAVLAADDLLAGRLKAEGLTLREHAKRWSSLYLGATVTSGGGLL